MARYQIDDLVDGPGDGETSPARKRTHTGAGKAIASGVMNTIFGGCLVALGMSGLPFIAPAAFGMVLPALLTERAGAAAKEFILVGYQDERTRGIAGLVRAGTGIFANVALWQNYPFLFSSIGLPPEIDRYLPLAFAFFALFQGIGAIKSLVQAIRGERSAKKGRKNRQPPEEVSDQVENDLP